MPDRRKYKETAYLIFIFAMGIAKNDAILLPSYLSLLLICIGLIFWLGAICASSYTIKERIIQLGLLLVCGIAGFFNHHMGPLLAVMVIIALKDVDISRVLWVVLGIQVACLLFNGSIFIVNIIAGNGIDGYYQQRNVMGLLKVSEQYRIFLGSLHPNNTQKFVCVVSVLLLYLKLPRIQLRHILILTIVNLGVYLLTFSNTGLTLWFFTAFIMWRIKKEDNWIQRISRISQWLFLALVIAIVCVVIFYTPDNPIAGLVNRLVTGRVLWAHQHWTAVGFTMWGRTLNTELGGELDCGYVNLLLNYGFIIFLIYCGVVFLLLKRLGRRKAYPEQAVLWFFHLFFIMESFIMVVPVNVTFIFIADLIYSNGTQDVPRQKGGQAVHAYRKFN